LAAWVDEVAALCQPDSVHWVTGTPEEIDSLNQALVASGTFLRLNDEKKPNSYWCASTRATSPASRTAPTSRP
jgi:phosphoenolpyruvate carboxykinase (GTP)